MSDSTGFKKLQQVIDDYADSVRAAKASGSHAPAEWAMKDAQKTVFECSLQYDSKLVSAIARAIEDADKAATNRAIEDVLNAGWFQTSPDVPWDIVDTQIAFSAAAIRKGPDHD